jgi:hypothetical protein
MSRQTVVRGICAACKFGPECVNHHGAAVMQCEQFAAESWSISVSSAHTGRAEAGLCADCLMDPMCILPRPAGGVWKCRDHQ